ncbi:MAG: transposase [Candidatus Kapabacteria bacterium]|nr:transposase [Candidatus Kapabacteria bacterium]
MAISNTTNNLEDFFTERQKKKVEIEVGLLALAHNLSKFVA